jgi:hypothetical protein
MEKRWPDPLRYRLEVGPDYWATSDGYVRST